MSTPPNNEIPEEQIQQAVTRFALKELECKACGVMFSMAREEVRFFVSRGLHLPKRCRMFRGKSKDALSTPPSMQNKFFAEPDPSRIPMVPWRHT
jgi:hypothetical protein